METRKEIWEKGEGTFRGEKERTHDQRRIVPDEV